VGPANPGQGRAPPHRGGRHRGHRPPRAGRRQADAGVGEARPRGAPDGDGAGRHHHGDQQPLQNLRALVAEGLDPQRPYVTKYVRAIAPRPQTLLYRACFQGRLDFVAYLVDECGCDPLTDRNTAGELPIHNAARSGHLPLLKWLFSRCPALPVDATTLEGATPLFMAAAFGRMETAKWLCEEKGADPLLKARVGGAELRPWQEAAHRGHRELAAYLHLQEELAKQRAYKQQQREKREAKARRRREQGGGGAESEWDAILEEALEELGLGGECGSGEEEEGEDEWDEGDVVWSDWF
jgi:hypothetical protein